MRCEQGLHVAAYACAALMQRTSIHGHSSRTDSRDGIGSMMFERCRTTATSYDLASDPHARVGAAVPGRHGSRAHARGNESKAMLRQACILSTYTVTLPPLGEPTRWVRQRRVSRKLKLREML